MPRNALNRLSTWMTFRVLACLVIYATVLRGINAVAQLPAVGTTEGYEAAEYYKQDFTKLKWRIRGAKAQPQSNDVYLLTSVDLQTFTPAGKPELNVRAPQCLYNGVKRSASSPGKLNVSASEGKFIIEGDGFYWRQTDGTNFALTISNNIQSTVQRPTTNAVVVPMKITSKSFDFDSAKRQGTFRENVRAEDPENLLTCATLTAIATPNTNTFDTLIGDKNVSVLSKKQERSAKADRAVYTRTNETMLLTGKVSWKDPQQAGRAERASIHWVKNEFEADGKVAMKLARGSLGLGGLFRSETNTVKTASTNTTPIDLFADHLQASTNLTTISGSVRIQDATNRLACDKVVIQTEGNEQIATADGNVTVCQGDGTDCLHSDRAVYTKSTGAAVFTGKPTWRSAQMEGRANRVTVQDTGDILASGDVATKVTLAGKTNALLNFFPNAADTNKNTQVFEAFSRELTANKRQVSLLGGARIHQSPITGSEPHLQSDRVDLFFSTNAQPHIELMEAKNNVRFEQGTKGVTNGPAAYRLMTSRTLRATWDQASGALSNLVMDGGVRAEQAGSVATGAKATYIGTNGDLELTGEPTTLDTPTAIITGAQKIVWNQKAQAFSAHGYKQLTLKSEALKKQGQDIKLDPTKPQTK